MAIKHLNIKITGFVQGVSFRYFAKGQADKLGLTGMIKNLPGASVYIEVEGDEDALKQFVSWCQKGSDLAKVEKVEKWEGKVKNFLDFNIY